MNLKTDIQIGFPLAAKSWEFVIVRSSHLAESLQGWITAPASGPIATKVPIQNLGGGTVLHFNDHFTTRQGFRFFHVADNMPERSPSRWEGHSDTAACALALAQSKVSPDAPIILVSCNCDFTPEGRLNGAILSPVSDSDALHENGEALFQKWQSATQKKEPVVGLVLFESDVAVLLHELKSRRQKTPSVTPIANLDVMQLLTLPRSWPALISVGEGDLPLLAEKLGIDGTAFKPRAEPFVIDNELPSKPNMGTVLRHDTVHPQSASQKLGKALFSLRTLKLLSLLGALGGTSLFAARSLLSNGAGGGDEPRALADLSTLIPGPSRPTDLAPPPIPPRDLAPALPPVDLASKTPLRLPPGAIRQFGGCDMVLIGADVMPPGLAPFWIDRTEVTTEAFEKCVDAGKCNFDTANLNAGAGGFCNRGPSRAQHPMNCVTFDEAANYCAQLGKTLPSAAQWDFAARGDTGRLFPWGETLPDGDALCWRRLSGTCPVEQHPLDKNPFGVVGMGANVAEWTETKFYPGNPSRSARVFRGWSWGTGTEQITERFGTPHGLQADKGQNNLGLRCVKPFSDTDER